MFQVGLLPKVVHQNVLWPEVLVEDVLLPPEVFMLGGAQSEENSLAQSQDLRVDSGNVDKVSSGILPEKTRSTLRILKGYYFMSRMKWEHWEGGDR
ncbi:hypothetical protein TNCV_1100531 [Trichonephila clavipes]|nr:hypothetical protein TNCV_1100531 [Trichonephila clavipes]